MKRFKWILVTIILLTPQICSAQMFPAYWGWGRASTPLEGGLTGMARLAIGNGYFLRSLGAYENQTQDARRKAIENWSFSVREWWAIRDEYKERNRYNALDREEERLDTAERRHKLKLRESDLIAQGVLPPRPESSVTVMGKKFKNRKEWEESPEYAHINNLHKIKEVVRDMERIADEAEKAHNLEKLAEYRRLSPEERIRRNNKKMAEQFIDEVPAQSIYTYVDKLHKPEDVEKIKDYGPYKKPKLNCEKYLLPTPE